MLETLGAEWAKKWRVEAMAEGRAEGRAEGQALLLIDLLEQRFGPLSDDRRHRILSADETTRAAWAKRLLEATSIDDVLSQPH